MVSVKVVAAYPLQRTKEHPRREEDEIGVQVDPPLTRTCRLLHL